MENQHRKIAGYRELSQAEIDLMNEIKAEGPRLQALCDKVRAHVQAQKVAAADNPAERARLQAADPDLWEAWGRNGMQSALMQLTRAVAQPTFF
jgi:hypothetical protein